MALLTVDYTALIDVKINKDQYVSEYHLLYSTSTIVWPQSNETD